MISILQKNGVEEKSKIRITSIRRLLIVSFIFSLLGFVIIMKIMEINLKKDSTSITDKSIKNIIVERGIIKDRNGRILASNIFKYNLKAYPNNIKNVETTIKKLSKKIPNLDEKNLRKKLNNKNKFEVILRKNMTAPNAKEINSMGIPGLEFFPVLKRYYPHQSLTSHIVGHVNDINLGVYGAEKTFDSILGGGKNISLAIDIRIQFAIKDELLKVYDKLGAKSATAIIADINNFEILSLVSLPDFNPNKSINPKNESYRNSATLNVYEMGSTFKIFTIAAALEETIINLESSFDARKPLKVSNYFIKDFHPENRILNTKEVFTKSSNIGASLIGLELGANSLKRFHRRLGIFEFSSIDLFEKSKPIVPKTWGEIETATLSFGHGISITPMHMVEAASYIFSNYEFEKFTIKKQKNITNRNQNKFLSENTRKSILELMTANVLEGTGKQANLKGYNIGGKTATGEKTIKGKYEKNKLVSSFLSVFPAEDPKYISLILFDEPNFRTKNIQNNRTGGATAAPATAKILKRILPILGIASNGETVNQILVKQKDKLNFAAY